MTELQVALRQWFALVATLAAGESVRAPTVRGVGRQIQQAWAVTPDAEALYRATADAWERETGRCAADGRRGCQCRAAQEGTHATS
jgi:hypothetical protein